MDRCRVSEGQWNVVWQEYFVCRKMLGGLCGCLLNFAFGSRVTTNFTVVLIMNECTNVLCTFFLFVLLYFTVMSLFIQSPVFTSKEKASYAELYFCM